MTRANRPRQREEGARAPRPVRSPVPPPWKEKRRSGSAPGSTARQYENGETPRPWSGDLPAFGFAPIDAVQIDAAETIFDVLIGHGFARIDVGPQIVLRDAIKALGREHIFGGQLLRLIDPAPHCRLWHAEVAGECGIAACRIAAFDQGLETVELSIHKLIATHEWIDSQPENGQRNIIHIWVDVET